MSNSLQSLTFAAAGLAACAGFIPPAAAVDTWSVEVRTLDVGGRSEGRAIAADKDGNVYVGGHYGGTSHLAKFDVDGAKLWDRSLKTGEDKINDVAVDEGGNVYVGGSSLYCFGQPRLAKFDDEGTLYWRRSLSIDFFDWTPGYDVCLLGGVAVDPLGDVYVAAYTEDWEFRDLFQEWMPLGSDALLYKYGRNGTALWKVTVNALFAEFDSKIDVATDVNGNVYLVSSAWIAKYAGDGVLLWSRQFGRTDYVFGENAITDASGNLYVSGSTSGALFGASNGEYDAWVAKYDGNGNLLWGRQIGTPQGDYAHDLCVDDDGNVYVVGSTWGSLLGASNGMQDAVLVEYDGDGNLLRALQFGSATGDSALACAVGPDGNIIVTGYTGSEPSAFIAKLTPQAAP